MIRRQMRHKTLKNKIVPDDPGDVALCPGFQDARVARTNMNEFFCSMTSLVV